MPWRASCRAWNLAYTVPPNFPRSLRGRGALGADGPAWGGRRRTRVPAGRDRTQFTSEVSEPSAAQHCPAPSAVKDPS